MLFRNSGVRLAGLLVPVVFAASMVVPHEGELPLGIHEALGCSGSGAGVPGPGGNVAPPEPNWFSLAAADVGGDPNAPLRVGSDGFVVLNGSPYDLTPEQALAGIHFVVTDDTGAEVPGTVAPLGDGIALFAWTASKPLNVGALLKASLSATPTLNPANTEHTYTLEVVGAPAQPNPTAKYANWAASYEGTGPLVDCPTAGTYRGGCSPQFVIQVPSSFEADGGYVDLYVDGAPSTGVAWEVTIAQSVAHPDSKLYYAQTAFITGPNSSYFDLGRVGFGLDADEACALVIVKDLRTGKEVSAESCSDKQPATTLSSNSGLAECTEPPNEAVRDLWCQTRLGASCDGTPIPLDDMPNEDKPQDPPKGPGTPNEATDPNDANTPDSAHESSGCQFGHSSSSGAWLLSGLGLAFAALRRRRTQP